MVSYPRGYFANIRLEIHESAIMKFTQPGGSVFKFTHNLVREAAVYARAEAPVRTLELANSIEAKRPTASGPYSTEGRVYAHVEYARWVHEGTGPRIYPKYAKFMRLPPWGPYGWVYAKKVNGQEENPFLRRGLDMAMVRNGLV